MAEKTASLSIVIRTVDQATAKIKAINDRLEKVTKPIRDFKEQLGKLRETSGLDAVADGFRGVGSALGDLLGKVALIGGVVGVAVAGLLGLVKQFDDLGDKAQRLGVGVDFLASMRFAAERSGAEVEQLDGGIQAFTVSLGKARAGTGRMLAFLMKVNPAFAAQLKGAKSNEEAFGFLADAMAKLTDPAKKAALATAAVGDPALAPLLSLGSKGIKELTDEYAKLAPGQKEAADAAGLTDDALKNMHAASDGVKAALITGLAPALTGVIKQITEWLTGHRADIKEWAAELGKRIPEAVSATVDAVKSAVAWVGNFVDKIGGWRTVAVAVAAVMAGPLISAVVALGVALMTTPLGWVITSVTAIIALFKTLHDHFGTMTAVAGTLAAVLGGLFALGPIKAYVGQLLGATKAMLGLGEASAATSAAGGVGGKGRGILGTAGLIAAPIAVASAINDATGGSIQDQARAKGWTGEDWDLRGAAAFLRDHKRATDRPLGDVIAQSQATIASATQDVAQAKITIDIANAPPGTRVRTDPNSTADVDFSVGYQTLFGAALP